MFVPMELSRVLILDTSSEQFITLTEKGGARSFAIKIGVSEAMAIERRLRGDQAPRPQTHDLLDSVIRLLGGELLKIVVHRLENGTYFASLLIEQRGEPDRGRCASERRHCARHRAPPSHRCCGRSVG